jgi:hypothetical protein
VVTLLGPKAITALPLGPDPLVRPSFRPQRDAHRDNDRADRPERSHDIRPARPAGRSDNHAPKPTVRDRR